MSYTVFVSHASADKWVAEQFAKQVENRGARAFLDARGIETGDRFDDELKKALNDADELLVLLTPAALERPYVWIEIGVAWSQEKRIVGILYGVTTNELASQEGTPAFMKGILLRDITDFDEYLGELSRRLGHD